MNEDIIRAGIVVSAIDGVVHENEKKYLLEHMDVDIDSDRYSSFLRDTFENADNKKFLGDVLNKISKGYEQEECIEHITKLIAADNILHEKERQFVELISEKWNIYSGKLLKKIIIEQRKISAEIRDWHEYLYFICANEECNAEIVKETEKIFSKELPDYDEAALSYNAYKCSECTTTEFIIYDSNRRMLFDPRSFTKCIHCNNPLSIVRPDMESRKMSCKKCAEKNSKNKDLDLSIIPEHLKLCNKCGAETIMRTNHKTKNKFIGCYQYPKCRWAESFFSSHETKDKAFDIKGLALELMGHAENFYEKKDISNLIVIKEELNYRINKREKKGKKPTNPSLFAREKVENFIKTLSSETYID